MFGRNKSTPPPPEPEIQQNDTPKRKNAPSNNASSACVIVHGTVIEGSFTTNSDTRLDGTIKGNVVCQARIIFGENALVEGTLQSNEANISGVFNGEMTVENTLALGETAKVEGKVKASKLEVEAGAILNGEVLIGQSKGGKK